MSSDRASRASDRSRENQNGSVISSSSCGLDLCHPTFNDVYRNMLSLELRKQTGKEISEELLGAVEERLNLNGYKIEDIGSDAGNYQGAIGQALGQANDEIELKKMHSAAD